MNAPLSPRQVVAAWFDAMQRGSQPDLVALFAEDAVYVQPFGPPEGAEISGREAIAAHLTRSLAESPPDLTLRVDRVDVLGPQRVHAAWTCESPAFPGPMRGTDDYWLREGLITRLETRMAGPL